MIYSLEGTVSVVLPTAMVLTVNHVGYMVHCTQPVITTVAIGDHRQLIIYHHIREDAHVLYGFESSDERNLFETLISVSGIGPKVGMAILSNMTPAHLVHAIQTDNIMLMTQLPGIGKKTAERMMVELKDKMNAFAVPEGTPTTPSATIEAP
ncbi:MAG: Holliday junction branch migration protein RuvA, partial [Candidatus Marinamargulisbacteria bacterium]